MDQAGRVRRAALFFLSVLAHAVLIFAAFNVRGYYKIFTYADKARDAFLAPREIFRYPLALRSSPRPTAGRPGSEAIAATIGPGVQPDRTAAPPAAGARQTGSKTAAANPAVGSGEPSGAGPGGEARSGAGGGRDGFKLAYPSADAKISLSKSAASIEDSLVPPGLYRDYSKVDLNKTSGRGEGPGGGGGGGPVVGQAVPRAKRQTGRDAVVVKLPGIDFKPWAEIVLNKIQKNWALPLSAGSGWLGETGVRVLVAKNGQVLSAELDAPTKVEILDQAALRAILASGPFPALPASYPQSSLEVYFVFRYGG
ncbi:MAG: TonB C-terminal domain-containing protein [Candidatus Aminicenantes bacterium]|nr:TonB C-terminal domain-containing protein [Candidatus Aminicenantes bacterium]